MEIYTDFSQADESTDEPLVIHQHGDKPGRALLILAHGLGGTRYGTWTPKRHRATEVSLPRFLYDDIDGLDVGLYEYVTLLGRLRWWRSIELQDEARGLADVLRDLAHTYRCIILGGHSMGGILMSAAIRELISRDDAATLRNLKALLLMATPLAGSLRVPRIVWRLTADARALAPHNKLVAEIDRIFTEKIVAEAAIAKRNQYVIPAYAIAGLEDQWVDHFSSVLHIPRERIRHVRGSHTSPVKPRTKNNDGYRWLKKHIEGLVQDAGPKLFRQRRVHLPVDGAVKSELIAALKSSLPIGDLRLQLIAHAGRCPEAAVVTEAAADPYTQLVEWAAQNPPWVRVIARVMIEERPQDKAAAAFALKHQQYGPILATDEREQLRHCLAAALADASDFTHLVADMLDCHLHDLLGTSLPGLDEVNRSLPLVIRRADHFDQIEQLIETALERYPGPVLRGKAQPLLDTIRSRQWAPSRLPEDPFDAHDLGGKFLIDRTGLRDAMRGIVDARKNTRVVAVRGPSRSGKSYSIYYIEHIEQRLGQYDKVVIRLDEDEPPATFTPEQLAESILYQIGLDATGVPRKTVDISETRWIKKMAEYLVGRIKTKPRIVFIVLDGFAHEHLPALTRELVRELVKRADSEPKLRVALLDYSDDLLPVDSPGRFVTEPISEFTDADLTQFFIDYARAHGTVDPPLNAIETIVRSVLDAAAQDPNPDDGTAGHRHRNERIAQHVGIWTSRLRAGDE